MQYILSQEEMADTSKKLEAASRLPSVKKLQAFCTMVANTLVLTSGWRKGSVWGCILTEKEEEWYCDDCPAQEVCPYDAKHWSK